MIPVLGIFDEERSFSSKQFDVSAKRLNQNDGVVRFDVVYDPESEDSFILHNS